MTALTICQPYADLIANGSKLIENRTWPTSYRGRLAIHAGKSRAWLMDDEDPAAFVFGAIVAVATLADCLELRSASWPSKYQHLKQHEHCGGPWCWILEDVRRVATPIPFRGAQGLWQFPGEIAA